MKRIINMFIIAVAFFIVSCNHTGDGRYAKDKPSYDEGDIVVIKLTNDTVILQYHYGITWHARTKLNTAIEFRDAEIIEKIN